MIYSHSMSMYFLVRSKLMKTALCAVLFFIGAFFVSASSASASTNVSGTIGTNTTWNTAGSPYIVTGTTTVSSGVTLTIDAGVTVKFQSGSSVFLSVSGNVDANGTSGSPVIMTSNAVTPAAGDWYGIEFLSGSTGDFTYTEISYGGRNCTSCYPKHKMIWNQGGTLTFTDSSLLSSWKYAIYQNSGTTTMTRGLINNNTDGVYQYGGTMTFSDVEIKDLIDARDTATSLTIDDSYVNTGSVNAYLPFTFTDNTLASAVIRIKRLSTFTHSGNTVSSGTRGYYLDGQTASDANLTAESGLVYLIDAPFYVMSGHTLTVEPDSVFKFLTGTDDIISVAGTIEVNGTSADPVYFTSYKNDSAGGDTNNDSSATSPAAGDWYGFEFTSGSIGNFSNTAISYGGKTCASCTVKEKMILNSGGVLTFDNVSLVSSLNYGIYQTSGSVAMSDGLVDANDDGIYYNGGTMTFMDDVQIKDWIVAWTGASSLSLIDTYLNTGSVDSYVPFTFTGNELYNATVKIKGLSDFIHSGNTVTGGIPGYYLSGQTDGSATIAPESGIVYIINDSFSVNSGETLNIEAGTIVKMAHQNAAFWVDGSATLNLNGTPASPVYFTSYKDDSIGGDTNNNGASSGATGDWGKINFSSGSAGSVTHAVIRYGGYNSTSSLQYMVLNAGGTVDIVDTDFTHSHRYGLYQSSGTASVVASTFSNQIHGVYVTGGTIDLIGSSMQSNSQVGVYVTGGTVSVSGSTLSGNTSYGVYSTGTAVVAEGNYWGHASGPYHASSNPSGTGDDVSDNVDFDPFETALETTGPSLSITSPADESLHSSATVTVEGTVSDAGSGVAAVWVNGIACAIDTGDWSCEGVTLIPGTDNTITASAWDNDGNRTDETIDVDRKVPVILLPGIAASHLDDGEDHIWLDLVQMALDGDDNFLTDSLSLNSSGESIEDITVGDILRTAPGIDIYEGLIDELETNNGYVEDQTLFVFPYDWRLDLRNTSVVLATFIDDVLLESGSDQVDLVTHSMGGLLAKQYIYDEGGEKVRKTVYVGTPHLGSPYAAEGLLLGTDFGINSPVPILNTDRIREIAENAPTVYQLLPSPKYISDVAEYLYVVGPPYVNELSYNESAEYLENDWSLNSYLLDEAKEFHDQKLEYIEYAQIEAFNIAACAAPTGGGYFDEDGELSLIGWIGGDMTVPYQSADFGAMPESRKYYVPGEETSHGGLASIELVREAIAEMLTESGTSALLALDADTTNCGATGDSLTWMSPVDVHIYDSEGRHTGLNDRGEIERQIPGVGYKIVGHYKFVFLPTNDENYDVVAVGTDDGTFDLRYSSYVVDKVSGTTVFNDVPVHIGTKVEFARNNMIREKRLKVTDAGIQKIYQPFSDIAPGTERDLTSPMTASSIEEKSGRRQVVLNSTEDGNGAAVIYYSMDGATFEKYTGPILLADHKDYEIHYYSVDRAGNNEQVKIFAIQQLIGADIN